MPQDYVIIDITEEPRFERGRPTADLRVQFMVGDDGPFFERFPKAQTEARDIATRLRAVADLVRQARQ